MSYRFCLGASGAGKSTYLYREAVRTASEALEKLDFRRNIMIIVPDQFTMQTQKDLVRTAGEYAEYTTGDCGGIMNIDVLSFGRLAHRIFGEIGAETAGVLDDMGKSLILRRLAAGCSKELKVLGQKVTRPGMIAEVKSILSEFMQYGVSVDGVGELAAYAAAHGQGALAAKLSDLQVLYRAFLEERGNRFLTGEETMDLLTEAIPQSGLIPRSVIIFDGFTGFTPVQNRAILALMQCAPEVIIALDYAEDGGTPITDVMEGAPYEEQDLFYLTRQTVSQICRMGAKAAVEHGEDIYIEGGRAGTVRDHAGTKDTYVVPPRFLRSPALAHLERALFRNPVQAYAAAGRICPSAAGSAEDGPAPGPKGGPGSADGFRDSSRGGPGSADGFRDSSRGGPGSADGLRDNSKGGPEGGTGFAADMTPDSRGGGARAADGGEVQELPVHLILASNPGQEVRQMFLRIRRLLAEKGYHYRDIAVVTGDLSQYEDEVRVYAERYDVPIYIDTRRAVTQNPLTETIRSALEIGGGDYSYETVFRFLRGGLSGMETDAVDRLENYCLKRGIASRRRWEMAFDPEYEPLRQAFLRAIGPLQATKGAVKSDAAEEDRTGTAQETEPPGGAGRNKTEGDTGSGNEAAKAPASAFGRTPAGRRRNARERTRALYEFLLGIHAGEQMQELAKRLRGQGLDAQAMEYEQIYGAVIHLLDELYELPGQEPISARDYLDLVTTGFQEIRIGTLPQQVDRISIGDMERTRLSEVKVLFVLGVNDGNIPRGASKGGLLSDLDREFLQESDILRNAGASLAPTPREQMYIQRLYLYMNLTKPSQELYISYAGADANGGSLRPSYLIGLLRQMYPQMETQIPEEAPAPQQMAAAKDAAGVLAGALRDYADGLYLKDPERRDDVLTIYGFCVRQQVQTKAAPFQTAGSGPAGRGGLEGKRIAEEAPAAFADGADEPHRYHSGNTVRSPMMGDNWARTLRKAAFLRYRAIPLSKETSRQIYGRSIRGSVTRLETAANCYLRQFLQYGLRLKEREYYTFESNDSGSILHDSIQRFGLLLQKKGLAWTEFTKEEGQELVAEALKGAAGEYNDQILYATARNIYQAGRLQRILERTADTLQYQLRQGDFAPYALEQDFGEGGEISFALGNGGRLILQGRIDRVDLARESVSAVEVRKTDADGAGQMSGKDVPASGMSAETGAGRMYVKIVDYKSGKKDLDKLQMKAGLQLQLLLYMMAEVDRLQGENPGTKVVPAGMLYYRFDDPALIGDNAAKVLAKAGPAEGPGTTEGLAGPTEGPGAAAMDAGNQIIRRQLRPKGLVGAEDDILQHMDHSLAASGVDSDVIPVRRNKDGSLSKTSETFTAEEYEELSDALRETVCRLAQDILSGRTDASPVRTDPNHNACTWCPYKESCGFDLRIPGYEYREIAGDSGLQKPQS